MADNITNKDYITITDSKVMVGDKETTKYRGENIVTVELLPRYLKDIQKVVKREYGIAPIEMHALSSKTTRNYARSGTPSATHGPNAWVRFMFANGFKTPWVFTYSFSSAANCALYCCRYVRHDSAFRSGVFGSVADKIETLAKSAPVSDKQYKVGEIVNMPVGNQILQVKIMGIKNKTL